MSDKNNQEKKLPVLKSAEELKGKKAAVPGKKRRSGWLRWLWLVLLLGILAGGWALFTKTDLFIKPAEPVATPAPDTTVKLITKTRADLDRVTVKNASGEYTVINNIKYDAEGNIVAKEGEALSEPDYLVEGQPEFKINQGMFETLHAQCVGQTALSTVDADAKDLSIFGLEKPGVTVEIFYKDGSKHTLYYGDQTPVGTSYYLMMDDSSAVYTIGTTGYNAFTRSLNSMHQVNMPATLNPEATIKSLLIEQQGKPTIEIVDDTTKETTSISTLRLVQPIEYEAHSSRTPEMAQEIVALSLTAYAGHAEDETALETYGLKTPAARVRYEDSEGSVLDMRIGKQADDLATYVTVDDTGDVYTVDTQALSFLANANANHLVDQFSNLVNIVKVDSVTVTAGSDTYTLSVDRKPITKEDGTASTEDTYLFDGAKTDESLFKSLYQQIIGLMVDKFRVEGDTTIPGNAVASVRYKLNNGMPDTVIEYLEYDADYCLVKQADKELFLIKQSKVQKMIDSCQQYREGTYVK